jgi:hypothetical protein
MERESSRVAVLVLTGSRPRRGRTWRGIWHQPAQQIRG